VDGRRPAAGEGDLLPALQVVDADRALGGLPDDRRLEEAMQLRVLLLDDRPRRVRPHVAARHRLLQVGVVRERQPYPELGEVLDDLVEAQRSKVAQAAGVGEREPVDQPDRIRHEELLAATGVERDKIGSDHLTADHGGYLQGSRERAHVSLVSFHSSSPVRKSRAVSCASSVVAQVILSSPPRFSL
jgi:hypothetical protein